MVHIKRVYEEATAKDGYRILVDRLWPRGVKKEDAQIDKWFKDIAPTPALRKWYGHKPEKWKEFVTRYYEELKDSAAVEELHEDIHKHKTVTLVFAAKDEEHSHALALLNYIKKHKKIRH